MQINETIKLAHKTAVDKGFWDNKQWNLGEKLMLITSELGEALEADRTGKYANKKAFEKTINTRIQIADKCEYISPYKIGDRQAYIKLNNFSLNSKKKIITPTNHEIGIEDFLASLRISTVTDLPALSPHDGHSVYSGNALLFSVKAFDSSIVKNNTIEIIVDLTYPGDNGYVGFHPITIPTFDYSFFVYGSELESDAYIAAFKEHLKDSFEDEMADAVIRLFDLAGKMNIDLEYHIQHKMKYNATRNKLHGKKY